MLMGGIYAVLKISKGRMLPISVSDIALPYVNVGVLASWSSLLMILNRRVQLSPATPVPPFPEYGVTLIVELVPPWRRSQVWKSRPEFPAQGGKVFVSNFPVQIPLERSNRPCRKRFDAEISVNSELAKNNQFI